MTARRDPPVVELKAEMARLRRGREHPVVKLDPASAYEAVTRQMVEGVREELREIRSRINGLIFLMIGALGAEAILRLAWG